MERPKATLADLQKQIQAWLRAQGLTGNEDLICEIVGTVLRLAGDEASRGDLKILNRALKELRQAFRIFAPYQRVRKVSIFGSTRVPEDEPFYFMARDL